MRLRWRRIVALKVAEAFHHWFRKPLIVLPLNCHRTALVGSDLSNGICKSSPEKLAPLACFSGLVE